MTIAPGFYCPRCQSRAAAQRFYGPCQDCRIALRTNALWHLLMRRMFDWMAA